MLTPQHAMALGILCLFTANHAAVAEETLTTVSGVVTVDGKALVTGRIFFYLDDEQFIGSKVVDGSYKVSRVPVGVSRIAFDGNGVPAKVSTENSGITVGVEPGNNTVVFDLKSP